MLLGRCGITSVGLVLIIGLHEGLGQKGGRVGFGGHGGGGGFFRADVEASTASAAAASGGQDDGIM